MAMFSIIIPVFNVAPYLRACLDSVLAQTNKGWNAICVDDGSTDGSAPIIDEYAVRDPRFAVVHQVNAGVSAARNVALERSTGDWVLFLDADDVLAPCALSHVEAAIRRTPLADVIAFKTLRFDDGERPELCGVSDIMTLGRRIDSRLELDVENATCHFFEKAYRRTVIGTIRFKPYVVGEDQLFMLEAMLASSCTQVIDSVLYGYRQRATSVVHSGVSARKVRDMICYNRDELVVIGNSHKVVSRAFVRQVVNWLTEGVFHQLMEVSVRSERLALQGEWREAIRQVSRMHVVKGVQSFRIRVYLAFPFFAMGWILFFVPRWLKLKGFHR